MISYLFKYLHYGAVWIVTLTCPAKTLALTVHGAGVWIATNYLVRPALPSYASSIQRQLFGETQAPELAAK